MAATVWLLVQLHQAEAIHLYVLPTQPSTFSHSPKAPADLQSRTDPARMTASPKPSTDSANMAASPNPSTDAANMAANLKAGTDAANMAASLKAATDPADMANSGGRDGMHASSNASMTGNGGCDTIHSVSSAVAETKDGKTAGGYAIARGAEAAPAGGFEIGAVGVIELTGLCVDLGIVVVLSWAAQLVGLQDTAAVIEGDSVTFSLGKPCLPVLACAASGVCTSKFFLPVLCMCCLMRQQFCIQPR